MVSLLVNRFLLFDKKLHYIALSTHLIYLNLLHMVIYRVIFKIFGNSGQSEQMLVMTDRCTCTGIYPLNISSALCHSKISKKIKYPIFLPFQCPVLAALLEEYPIECDLHDTVGGTCHFTTNGKSPKILLSLLPSFQACCRVLAN